MLLTYKAKEDFTLWLNNLNIAPYAVMFWDLPTNVQSIYIIEWFDSVGIYIQIFYQGEFYSEIKDTLTPPDFGNYKKHFTDAFETRAEATTEAIKKANILYNENK